MQHTQTQTRTHEKEEQRVKNGRENFIKLFFSIFKFEIKNMVSSTEIKSLSNGI